MITVHISNQNTACIHEYLVVGVSAVSAITVDNNDHTVSDTSVIVFVSYF